MKLRSLTIKKENMATKKQIMEELSDMNVAYNSRDSKENLETILDGLRVHRANPVAPLENLPDPGVEIPHQDEQVTEVTEEEATEEKVPVEETTGETNFDELLGKVRGADVPPTKEKGDKPLVEKTKRKKKKGESSPDSFRIEGYVLLLITDTIFPFALSFANNMLDKKNKLQPSDLSLNEKDFNKLEPLADQAADYMSVSLNPIAGFFLVASFMYANNLISIKMSINKN